ncbi:hypothetical protein [Streptomyces sp. KL116D]
MPTLVAAALFDLSVPPPGQFAVFNGLGTGVSHVPEGHP